MLIRVFKSNQNLINGLVILLTIFLWLPSFFKPLGNALIVVVSTGFHGLDISITILLIAAQAIYLNRIVSEYKLVENNSHLTSLFFVIFNSCFFLLFNLNQVVIANFFVLLGVHQMLRLYDNKASFSLSFNAGFLISIATVIYIPNGIFLILLWIGLIYMISPSWRDLVITLLGFSIPILYVVSYHFVVDDLAGVKLSMYNSTVFNVQWNLLSGVHKLMLAILVGLITMAYFRLTATIHKGGLRRRKMLTLIILMSVFSLGSLLFNGWDYLATFVVLTIPCSIVVANLFQNLKKKWLAELFFTLFFGVVLLSYFS
jgi:hypothetical protein